MNNQNTFTLVKVTLGTFTKEKNIQKHHHLIRDLALDSLDVMDALQQLEDEFELFIPSDILPSLQTVGDLVQELDRRLNAKRGSEQ